jgi:large subunit ribosomal protein L18
MNRLTQKIQNAARRKNRVRSKVFGTTARPRLTVTISNQNISVQVINDETHTTLVSATTIGKKLTGTMTEKATIVGKEIGEKAKKAKITKVVFDRNGKLYHGRIKALAEAARAEGLEF